MVSAGMFFGDFSRRMRYWRFLLQDPKLNTEIVANNVGKL